MQLTPKQARFVDEYLVDLNATQAAIRAGYSEKSANEQGCRLLVNVKVAQALIEAKAKRSERTKIDSDWVLSRLADQMDADIADLYFEHGGLKPVNEWPEVFRKGLVAGLDVQQQYMYQDGEKTPDGFVMKVKLADRLKVMDQIGKHVDVQAFKEKVESTASVNHNVMLVPSCSSVEEWEAAAQQSQAEPE